MSNHSRRIFVQSVASMPLAACSRLVSASTSDDRPVLVDTHLHCFAGADDNRFPYHARAPYRPDESATPEHLLKCMDDAGVQNAIVVHPEPYQDDHRYLQHCLRIGGRRLKGTLLLFADRPGQLEKLPLLAEQMDVVSVRIHAYAPDRLPPFGSSELRKLWQLADENGLAVELHFEPRYAAGFEPLIKEFSTTRVIIDHMGRPFQGTPTEHAVVLRWAELPNTVMKLSSIPSNRNYPHREIQPVIRQLTEAWGADRMIYGGGFNATATGESYRAAFDRARSLLSHLTVNDQNKVLGETAVRLFGFENV